MGSEVYDLIHCTKFLLRLTYLLVQSVFIWIIQLVGYYVVINYIVSINGNKIIILGIVLEIHVSNTSNDISRVWASKVTQITKFMGPTWGPPGSCRPQMGPMLAPWILLSGKMSVKQTLYILYCFGVAYTVRCHYNAVNFFQKSSQETLHSLSVGARYGVPFVNLKSDLYSALVNEMVSEISCYTVPRYNGTWWYKYLKFITDLMQNCSISSALAMEKPQCAKPAICHFAKLKGRNSPSQRHFS